jgi:hypothetical protein
MVVLPMLDHEPRSDTGRVNVQQCEGGYFSDCNPQWQLLRQQDAPNENFSRNKPVVTRVVRRRADWRRCDIPAPQGCVAASAPARPPVRCRASLT